MILIIGACVFLSFFPERPPYDVHAYMDMELKYKVLQGIQIDFEWTGLNLQDPRNAI